MSLTTSKTNGWTPLAVGEDIPARTGQSFDVRLRRNDEEVTGFTWGKPEERRGHLGTRVVYHPSENEWNTGDAPWDIIAYRLHEPEAAAEEARRAARIANFRKIAAAAPIDSSRPEREPVSAPFCRRETLNPPISFHNTGNGLIAVSLNIAAAMVMAAQDIRHELSLRLAEDLTPAERAELHQHIRDLTGLIERHGAKGGAA